MKSWLRTPLLVVLCAAVLVGVFTLPLGQKTLAEHIDAIGRTHEAEALLDGTRATINPALQEARDRVLGEYVEAPTRLRGESEPDAARATGAKGSRASTDRASKLPGRSSP